MNYSNEQINMIINRCENIVNDISIKHNYNENIKHLLYIIIPAFLLKYELRNEKQTVISTFFAINRLRFIFFPFL